MERTKASFDVTIRTKTTAMSVPEMITSLTDFDVLFPTLGDLYSKDIFAQAGDIRGKLLANFGVGYTHIDVDAAKIHVIEVSNIPGAVTGTAMTLTLMDARRTGEGSRMLRAGAWAGWHPTQMLGVHIIGKTIDIMGMGRIGQAIARRCHFGFGMKVVFFNRSQKDVDFRATQLDSIGAVAASCDIMVIATLGGVDTTHLINAETFNVMQLHAFLINIARGEVVDEVASIAALNFGQIAGAGLDVYEFEPKVPEALIQMENVMLLPHLGTATHEVRTDMGMLAVDNVERFARGEGLVTPV